MKVVLSALLFIASVCQATECEHDIINIPLDNITLSEKNTSLAGTIDVADKLPKTFDSSCYPDRKIFVIGAANDVIVEGDVTFTNSNDVEDHALVLATADDLVIKEGTKIKYQGSNLTLSSENTISLVNVDIEAAGNIAIGTLNDLYLTSGTTISAGINGNTPNNDLVLLYANDYLNINNVVFSEGIREIHLDAKRVAIKNLTLPSDSILKINVAGSRKWQNAYVTVEGTSLKFSGDASTVADVVLENVIHPELGVLSLENTPTVTEKEGEQSPSFTVTDLGNNWYQHDQFGTFYDANNSDWYYHLDHGWIYVDEWGDNGTWIYMPINDQYNDWYNPESNSSISEAISPGWMWSNTSFFPQLYSDKSKGWLYGYGDGIFYEYRTKELYAHDFQTWDLNFTDKNKTTAQNIEHADTYYFLFSYDYTNDIRWNNIKTSDLNRSRLIGTLMTVHLSLPSEILTEDNNWSKLIELCKESPLEMKKRAIFDIEENAETITLSANAGLLMLRDVTFPNTEVIGPSRDVSINDGIGSVNFFGNVKHGSDLITGAKGDAVNEFNGIDGHWDLNKKLENGKSAFVIRQR